MLPSAQESQGTPPPHPCPRPVVLSADLGPPSWPRSLGEASPGSRAPLSRIDHGRRGRQGSTRALPTSSAAMRPPETEPGARGSIQKLSRGEGQGCPYTRDGPRDGLRVHLAHGPRFRAFRVMLFGWGLRTCFLLLTDCGASVAPPPPPPEAHGSAVPRLHLGAPALASRWLAGPVGTHTQN